MKWIIASLIAMFAIQSFVWAAVFWPDSAKIGGKEIPEEVKRVDCNTSVIAKVILEQTEIVPTRIYHFGRPIFIAKDVLARTIPQEDWDKFVMGEEGRYPLKVFRRGLSGTATLEVNEFRDKNNTALMEIEIEPDCISANQVVTLIDLPKDAKFKKWFASKEEVPPYKNIQDFQERCFFETGDPKIVSYGSNDLWLTPCEIVITNFLNEANIKIVHDHVPHAKSFYIRDRKCIKNILGFPNELLEILAEKHYLWLNSCESSPAAALEVNYKNAKIFSILAETLKQTSAFVPDSVYTQLKENIGFLRFNYNNELSDEKAKKDWVDLLDAHKRCQLQNKMKEFQEILPDIDGPSLFHAHVINISAICAF